MRLLNTGTFRLEEFYSEIPPYAILSHTWGDDEITFQDWREDFAKLSSRKSFVKIIGSCKQASREGYEYLWCDTNCIDKTSSAELTEAINSMFTWYQNAAVCYAFLSDVSPFSRRDDPDGLRQFCNSRWFTRGWTLQELLAPARLVFYDNTWTRIGGRKSLCQEICTVTGIRKRYLAPYVGSEAREDLSSASVAERMSWLSRRETTRIEDLAYCMLGIFDINMALLYGEGQKAFVRLQEEIIKASNDQTIFCWKWDDRYVPTDWVSMLSPSPKTFEEMGKYSEPPLLRQRTLSYTMTNAGLSIKLPISEFGGNPVLCLAVLDVREADLRVAIPLLGPVGKDLYQRSPFPRGPVPMLASTRTEDRDMKVFVRRGKLPRMPLAKEPLDFDYGVLFRHHDEVISARTEWDLISRNNDHIPLNMLRLERFDNHGHFGCLLPLWVCPPKGGVEEVSLRVGLKKEKEVLAVIFFGVQVRQSHVLWRCKVVDIIAEQPKYEGDGQGSTALGPYRKTCEKILRQMEQWLRSETPGNMSDQSSDWKTFRELGINISVFLGASVRASDRAEISLAQIHFSIIPRPINQKSKTK